MKRYQAMQIIMDQFREEPVVCNIGHPSQELYAVEDRATNFYMLGSMGLASSVALGLAMSLKDQKVLCFDGDGSVLMNLGSLTTIGTVKPDNLILFIIDNGAYGSTGHQPTFASSGLQIEEIAKACGISRTLVAKDEDELKNVCAEIQGERVKSGPCCVLVKTEIGVYDQMAIIPMDSGEIKQRFMETL